MTGVQCKKLLLENLKCAHFLVGLLNGDAISCEFALVTASHQVTLSTQPSLRRFPTNHHPDCLDVRRSHLGCDPTRLTPLKGGLTSGTMRVITKLATGRPLLVFHVVTKKVNSYGASNLGYEQLALANRTPKEGNSLILTCGVF